MSIYKKILVFALIISLYASSTKVIADPIEIVNLPVNEQISYFSELYGADVSLVRKVIECESGFDNSNIGDSGLSRGIFQFQRSTFNRMEKLLGEDLNYESQYDQLKLGIYAMSKPELAREWSTWVAIKNGGVYHFYSRQLGREFTVYCKL